MMTNMKPKRHVVCAALKASDGSLLLGVRHYSPDMINQIESRIDGYKFLRLPDENQGFVDQWGTFMSRKEAFIIAQDNNQIKHPGACTNKTLFSEGLY